LSGVVFSDSVSGLGRGFEVFRFPARWLSRWMRGRGPSQEPVPDHDGANAVESIDATGAATDSGEPSRSVNGQASQASAERIPDGADGESSLDAERFPSGRGPAPQRRAAQWGVVTPTTAPHEPSNVTDPALLAAVEVAREAVVADSGAETVGDHLGHEPEDGALTHLFAAKLPGYHGWRWAVTVANAGADTPVTVSEVVLLPGAEALTGPRWVPWNERVRAGDLGVGDLLPAEQEDDRLVPGYVESDDPAVEEVAVEIGLGRKRVLSRWGRSEAAYRWRYGEFGPRSDMARSAPASCGTCGFYLPIAGSLRAAFGACGNEIAPADGHVVHAEYGCGAHSEAVVDTRPNVPVTGIVYDDTNVDVEPKETAQPHENAEESGPAQEKAEPAADETGHARESAGSETGQAQESARGTDS
jgi:hypothetical protein